MKKFGMLTLLAALGLCAPIALPASAAGMKVGTGRVIITPEEPMWMAGYSARKAPSDGKLHDLYAKALLFEDEQGVRSVILTTDLLGLSATVSAKTAELVKQKLGIPRERLMLTASHTHSGPVIRDNLFGMYALDEAQQRIAEAYTEALPGLLLRAIEAALDDLSPATLHWGIGEAGFAVNRREYTPNGVINRMNPIGPVDHSVPVLVARHEDGQPRAVLFGYACHCTVLNIQQFNGDYAGFAQAHIEAALPGANAMFVAGCGGDINPLPRREIELAMQYGQELGAAVLTVLDTDMAPIHGPIRAVYKEIPLQLSEPPSREEIERQAKDGGRYVQRRAKSLLRTLDEKGALDTTYPYPIQLWQFSDTLQMTALAGEVVVDYALLLKHAFGSDRQFVIAYANDVCAYIPSLRVLREGGYEGVDAMVYYGLYGPWAPNVQEHIMHTVHEMIEVK